MEVHSTFKRAYHAARNLPDRLLHNRRHLSVCLHLSRVERPRRILVVCHGNICRSPYLEAVLIRSLPDIHIASAGFVGPGRPVPAFALEVSAQRGLDLISFRSQLIRPDDLREAELVVVMDERQARHLVVHLGVAKTRIIIAGDLDPTPGSTRAVQDPWNQPREVFASSFDRLDRCAATLITLLRR